MSANGNWVPYFATMEDRRISLLVDLQYRHSAPIDQYNTIVTLEIKLRHPNEFGLVSDRESDILFELEKYILTKFDSDDVAFFVGKISDDGKNRYYFYTRDKQKSTSLINEVMVMFNDQQGWFKKYKYVTQSSSDESWEFYSDFLLPSSRQIKIVNDNRMIRHLEELGDDIYISRNIDHSAIFETAESRAEALLRLKDEGFVIGVLEEPRDNKYWLHFARNEPLTQVSSSSESAMEIVESLGGEYDGWGSPVTKG